MSVTEITSGAVQKYRVHRMTEPKRDDKGDQTNNNAKGKGDGKGKAKQNNPELKPWKAPARNTIHNEIVTLSMVLKTAQRHGWLENLPDLSDPYRRRSKVEHRPWFTPNEYEQLYKATRANAANPKNPRFKWQVRPLCARIVAGSGGVAGFSFACCLVEDACPPADSGGGGSNILILSFECSGMNKSTCWQ